MAEPTRNERLRELRESQGWTQENAATAVADAVAAATGAEPPSGIDASWIGRLERGIYKWPREEYRQALRTVYSVSTDAELGFSGARSHRRVNTTSVAPDLWRLDQLRHALDDTFNEGSMTPTSLDDWENAVVRYGLISRDRPAGLLVSDLASDIAELHRLLSKRRPLSTGRRLARLTAQMTGLMCLTLIKMDDRQAFRSWARTARTAANEAGDPATLSWVLAQEAYGHYYSGDYSEAVTVAFLAEEATRSTPRVGAALAAALQARAHAAMGNASDCRAALDRAESVLSNLSPESVNDSAFGYDEGQLRFHEGNAYTHLHASRSAWPAQQRALELSAPSDFMDRTLIKLDRASCLAYDGDTASALTYATETLDGLNDRQREGIITLRGFELLNAMPAQQRALPAARELRERLATPDTDEVGQEW
jgi:transcriptional regulator with XRE-family HTH domain